MLINGQFQIVPFVSVSFGFLFTAILAAIRYKSVKNLHSELAETRIYAFIITASVCLLCFIVAYFASILVHDVGMGAGPEVRHLLYVVQCEDEKFT